MSELVAGNQALAAKCLRTSSSGAFASLPVFDYLVSTGNSSGLANLATGQLHASGSPTFMSNVAPDYGFGAIGTAIFGDTLSFKNPNAGPSTITSVQFSVQIDGKLGSFLPGFCCTSSGNAGAGNFALVGNTSAGGIGEGYWHSIPKYRMLSIRR